MTTNLRFLQLEQSQYKILRWCTILWKCPTSSQEWQGFFFRGQCIWETGMTHHLLLSKGISKAKQDAKSKFCGQNMPCWLNLESSINICAFSAPFWPLINEKTFLEEGICGPSITMLLGCRMCVNSSLIAVQIWSRGRLSPDFLLPAKSCKMCQHTNVYTQSSI